MENAVNMHPLRLGEILDGAVGLYKRNFWLLVGIIALAEIPLLLVQVVLPLLCTTRISDTDFSICGLINNSANITMRWFFVDGFGAAVLSYAIAQRYLHQPIGIFAAYRRLGTSLLSLMGILLLFPLILIAALVWGLVPCVGWISSAGIFLFLSMAVMPLIPTVVMIEHQPSLNTMLRAWDLARRRFFWILGFNIVMAIFSWTLAAGPSLVASILVTALIGNSLGVSQAMESFYGLVSNVSGTLFNMLFLPIQVGAWTLIYYDLRVRSEAFDLTLLVVDELEDANRQVLLPPLQKWLSGNDIVKIVMTSLLVVILFVLVNVLPIVLLFIIGMLAQGGT